MSIVYNLKSDGATFCITKFDDDMNVESSYLVSETECECPQGHRPVCRHRRMLPVIQHRANTNWFYCYDDQTWTQIGDADDEPVSELVPELALQAEPKANLTPTAEAPVEANALPTMQPHPYRDLKRRV